MCILQLPTRGPRCLQIAAAVTGVSMISSVLQVCVNKRVLELYADITFIVYLPLSQVSSFCCFNYFCVCTRGTLDARVPI